MRSGRRLLLINWSDQPRELSQAGLASRIARNFWTDAVVPIRHGRLTHVLAPHACLLVDMPRERERL
jgi:hypothetical protein